MRGGDAPSLCVDGRVKRADRADFRTAETAPQQQPLSPTYSMSQQQAMVRTRCRHPREVAQMQQQQMQQQQLAQQQQQQQHYSGGYGHGSSGPM